MNRLKLLIIPLLFISLLGPSIINAQGKLGVVGKFFTSQEANVLFGKVTSSFSIKASDLREALEGAKDYVLFTIKNKHIVIRDEKRNRLSDEDEKLDKNETLYIFSKSQVQKLLNSANNTKIDNSVQSTTDANIFVEIRAGVLTLTANKAASGNSVQDSTGETTLEFSLICPPICPE